MRLARLPEEVAETRFRSELREAIKILANGGSGSGERSAPGNPQAPRRTPELQPPYTTLIDACVQLAEADVVLAYVRGLKDTSQLASPDEFRQRRAPFNGSWRATSDATTMAVLRVEMALGQVIGTAAPRPRH